VKATTVRTKRRAVDRKRDAIDRSRGLGPPREDDPCSLPETYRRVRREIRQIRGEDVAHFLDVLARDWPDVQRAAIAWIDLVQVLVVHTETRHGSPGSGTLKKREVKAAIAYLMRSDRVDIPHVPRVVEPIVVDVIADFAVDVIVDFLNRNRERDPAWREAERRGVRWRAFLHKIARATLTPFGRVITRLYFIIRRPIVLRPALRSALDAVERDSLSASHPALLERVAELGGWIGRNHDSLVALFELVGAVVDTMEDFAHLDGTQKKACARRLIYAVLEDLGFDTGGFVVSVKLDMAIDFAIDAAVHLFERRGIFAGGEPLPLPAA
jgi:hypothetical protein